MYVSLQHFLSEDSMCVCVYIYIYTYINMHAYIHVQTNLFTYLDICRVSRLAAFLVQRFHLCLTRKCAYIQRPCPVTIANCVNVVITSVCMYVCAYV